MRKLILSILTIVLLCFLIPILFSKRFEEKEPTFSTDNNEQTEVGYDNSILEYNYQNYTTIKLLHGKTNEIEEVKLDEYLCNVVSAEMPATFEVEALKAQAIVARTYTIYKISNGSKHEGADICDSASCCQAWISKEDRIARWEGSAQEENWNKIVTAVESTIGKVIVYDGKPINAFFHSNSGGKTEIPINVWGGSGFPYLQVVETSGEDAYTQYHSEVTLTKEELISKMKEKYSDFEIDFTDSSCIQVTEITDSNRVRTLKIGNKNISGVEARSILGLKSTNFLVTIEGENIKFEVTGYGHGVGMSQTGADALAKQGKSYEKIIKHFYVGVDIIDM